MILKKPYAFFIKHFRKIHMILSLLMIYSILKTYSLFSFINEYIKIMINVSDSSIISKLFPNLFLIAPILIFIFLISLLITMIVKNKPKKDYIIGIITYAYLFVIILLVKNVANTLLTDLISPQTARIIRDLLIFALLFQFITFILTFIHATGFDIKKFDFQSDLKDLEISDEDKEEVELSLNYDINLSIRKLRAVIRNFKYTFKEFYIFWIIIFIIIPVIFISFISFKSFSQEPIKQMNENILANGINLKILNSYITNKNYKNEIITNEKYLVLKVELSSTNDHKRNLDTATTKISLGNYNFIPTLDNKNEFKDIGIPYLGEDIDENPIQRILIYEIPDELIKEKQIFNYIDKNKIKDNDKFKSTKVKLKTINLDKDEETFKFNLNDNVEFNKSTIKDISIKIKGLTFAKNYKLNYMFCIDKCYDSYEYIKPRINENYDKVVMKIEGEILNTKTDEKYDLYEFLDDFGILKFSNSNYEKEYRFNANEIKSKKKKEPNIYYIEVDEDILNANQISLIFKIRSKNYEYVLK